MNDTEPINLIDMFYEPVAVLNREHNVLFVQHKSNGKIYVRKQTDLYCKPIYQWLMDNPVKGMPEIYQVIEEGNALVIIEEYVSGNTLQEILDEQGAMQELQVMELMLQLCEIVKKLHSANPPIVHRDIKPENIILTPAGQIYLLDVDAAKQMDTKKQRDTYLMGTKGFAAPEQYGFGASDVRTDLYAMGILMNVLLTEKFPNECMSEGRLKRMIEQCTMLVPEERYTDIDQLERELKRSLYWARLVEKHGMIKMLSFGVRIAKNVVKTVLTVAVLISGTLVSPSKSMGSTMVSVMELIYFYGVTEVGLFLCCSVVFNLFNVHRKIPIIRSDNWILKLIGVFTLAAFIVLVMETALTSGKTMFFPE